MPNKESGKREWLLYSHSTHKVYCFYCCLLADKKSRQFCTGFTDFLFYFLYISVTFRSLVGEIIGPSLINSLGSRTSSIRPCRQFCKKMWERIPDPLHPFLQPITVAKNLITFEKGPSFPFSAAFLF